MINSFTQFLEKFPASFLLSIIFLVVLGVYVTSERPFLERLLDLFAGGILTATVGLALKRNTTEIKADTVQTDSLNPASMDNATVTADSFNADNNFSDENKEK